MADVMTPAQRSLCMSKNRGRDTGPELRLRRALWAVGLRYRLGATLHGRPDIVFPRARLAVFVDGCFWHGCPEHFQQPANNAAFWAAKIEATHRRDLRVDTQLAAVGWSVMRIWEHDVRTCLGNCVGRIAQEVMAREGRCDRGGLHGARASRSRPPSNGRACDPEDDQG